MIGHSTETDRTKLRRNRSGSDNECSINYANSVVSILECRRCGGAYETPDLRRHYCSPTCKRAAKSSALRVRQTLHRKAHPVRELCRQILKNAIALGKVRRVTRCERCGGRDHIEAHHHDYAKPFFVEWLCKSCHEVAAA